MPSRSCAALIAVSVLLCRERLGYPDFPVLLIEEEVMVGMANCMSAAPCSKATKLTCISFSLSAGVSRLWFVLASRLYTSVSLDARGMITAPVEEIPKTRNIHKNRKVYGVDFQMSVEQRASWLRFLGRLGCL